MKQVPYRAPTTLEWPVTLTVIWHVPSCMWTKCIFVYKGQNCNNYAEDIGCHHTKLSCLPLIGCLDVWTPAFWYEQLNIWLPYLCFTIHNSPPMPLSILETNIVEFLVFLISTAVGYKGNELCTIHHKSNIKEKLLWILNINLRWFQFCQELLQIF